MPTLRLRLAHHCPLSRATSSTRVIRIWVASSPQQGDEPKKKSAGSRSISYRALMYSIQFAAWNVVRGPSRNEDNRTKYPVIIESSRAITATDIAAAVMVTSSATAYPHAQQRRWRHLAGRSKHTLVPPSERILCHRGWSEPDVTTPSRSARSGLWEQTGSQICHRTTTNLTQRL